MVKVRQQLGKYRIEKRLAEGGFAAVYRALDTIEGIPVALKIPHAHLLTKHAMDDFRREVRLTARLDHPNILPIKNATYIDDRFVIVYPLGKSSLADRLSRRMSLRTAMNFAEQMLVAVAAAHDRKIVHLDVKPDNFIIFNDDRLRLTDFGIAKVAQRTIEASGAGTVGYIAPEQAMGRPSPRSDVFALGLIIYRMVTGHLPEWPFEWPPPGYDRLKRAVHPQFIAFLRRAMAVDQRVRYADARKMLEAFRRIKPRAIRHHLNGKVTRSGKRKKPATTKRDWKTVRVREFLRRYKAPLDIRCTCENCGEPVAEAMQACPWCGVKREKHLDETTYPARCPRCKRGMKLDWRFCAWCYGPAIGPFSNRQFTDKRYAKSAKCSNRACERKALIPFSRYCPWCRTKVKHKWAIPGGATKERCPSCRWGVVSEFWDYCPWCARKLG